MIHFRLGQRFQRERSEKPSDRIGLLLSGSDVLVGANAEPLLKVVPDVVLAAAALMRGRIASEVLLPVSRLVLVLTRLEEEAEIQVISLGRPVERRVGPVRVDLLDLCRAAQFCAEGFLSSLPTPLQRPAEKRMAEALCALGEGLRPAKESFGPPMEDRSDVNAPFHFGFSWRDPRGLLTRYRRRSAAPLGSLLADGEVFFIRDLKDDRPTWSVQAPPFLVMLDLLRKAEEALRLLELGEQHLSLALPLGGRAELALHQSRLTLGKAEMRLRAPDFLLRIFGLGAALAAFAVERNPAQANNPFIRELLERSRRGIGQLNSPRMGANSHPKRTPSMGRRKGLQRRPSNEPLSKTGKLKRLRFEGLWTGQVGVKDGDTPGLRLGKRSSIWAVSSTHAALFSRNGKARWQAAGGCGIAVSEFGILVAEERRLLFFNRPSPSARWMRDHDGSFVGPHLFAQGRTLLADSPGHTCFAWDQNTGLELWRGALPNSAKAHLALAQDRILLTSNAGLLMGLSLREGRPVFRLKASHSFYGPVQPLGSVFLGAVGEGEQMAALCCDVGTGAAVWTREAVLRRPTPPMILRERVFLLGARDDQAVLLCLRVKDGELLWERPLPLRGRGLYQCAAGKDFLVASSRDGTAVRVELDGRVSWRFGSGTDEETAVTLSPSIQRGVVVVPGPTVRAIEAETGSVLAELKAPADLCSCAVDHQLNLYLLDQSGKLAAFRLATYLSTAA